MAEFIFITFMSAFFGKAEKTLIDPSVFSGKKVERVNKLSKQLEYHIHVIEGSKSLPDRNLKMYQLHFTVWWIT